MCSYKMGSAGSNWPRSKVAISDGRAILWRGRIVHRRSSGRRAVRAGTFGMRGKIQDWDWYRLLRNGEARTGQGVSSCRWIGERDWDGSKWFIVKLGWEGVESEMMPAELSKSVRVGNVKQDSWSMKYRQLHDVEGKMEYFLRDIFAQEFGPHILEYS